MEINNNSIKKLIGEGETEEAFKLFNLFLDNINRYQNELAVVKGSYSNISTEKIKGIIDYNKSDVVTNRINDAILRISSDLEKELNGFISFKEMKISADSFEEQLKRKLETEYILEDKPLAAGNTSLIYKGIEKASNQEVIIRALKNQSFKSVEEKAALKIEMSKVLKVKHRSLIKIKSFRLEDYPACYVEEFIHGITLKKLLKLGPLPREKVFSIIIKLGKTLSYLHTKGIIHQRILPSKIFMDVEGVPVFSPFERFSNNANTKGLITLTKELQYMSPEEVKGEKTNAYSDQYRLGILMYEILTGEKLFLGNNMVEVFDTRAAFYDNESYRKEILNKLDVTASTKKVWLKMLSQIPTERYDSILAPIRLIKTKEGKINKHTPYQISFESYNRCRSKNLNFTSDFYLNLFLKDLNLLSHFTKNLSNSSEGKEKLEEITKSLKNDPIIQLRQKWTTSIDNKTLVFPETMLRSAITFLFSDFKKINHLDKIINLSYHKNISLKSFDTFLIALIETAKTNDYLWNEEIEKAWYQTKKDCLQKIGSVKKA